MRERNKLDLGFRGEEHLVGQQRHQRRHPPVPGSHGLDPRHSLLAYSCGGRDPPQGLQL